MRFGGGGGIPFKIARERSSECGGWVGLVGGKRRKLLVKQLYKELEP